MDIEFSDEKVAGFGDTTIAEGYFAVPWTGDGRCSAILEDFLSGRFLRDDARPSRTVSFDAPRR